MEQGHRRMTTVNFGITFITSVMCINCATVSHELCSVSAQTPTDIIAASQPTTTVHCALIPFQQESRRRESVRDVCRRIWALEICVLF